jgi:hypothetical protein
MAITAALARAADGIEGRECAPRTVPIGRNGPIARREARDTELPGGAWNSVCGGCRAPFLPGKAAGDGRLRSLRRNQRAFAGKDWATRASTLLSIRSSSFDEAKT